jgi:hypothetical protein
MRGHELVTLLCALALPLAACGGGDDGGTPDAGDDASGTCPSVETPTSSVTHFPASYSGSLKSSTNNLHVASGVCTTEVDPGDGNKWYDETGPDNVLHLTGLTPNTVYGVVLECTDDLGFYVITGCDAAAGNPGAGQCLLFDDEFLGSDEATFTAPTTGEVWIVVDTALTADDFLDDGNYTIKILEPQCEDNTECTAPTPDCFEYECAECIQDDECTDPSKPQCNAGSCAAGPAECTGDDANDDGGGNDSLHSATPETAPTAGVPTVISANICSQPAAESDWYKITVGADSTLGFATSSTGLDLDVYVQDADGNFFGAGTTNGTAPEEFTADVTAGDVYIQVLQYDPAGVAAAAPYTLTVSVPECTTAFDCVTPTTPTCNGAGTCIAGPGLCTGDDAGDDGATPDDGPINARDLTPTAVETPRAIQADSCNASRQEDDWYKITVVQGAGLTLNLSFATSDLDVIVYDATGKQYGGSIWVNPEVVDLSYLPTGLYYVEVYDADSTQTATSVAYTITATTHAAQVCVSADDCDNVYSTQFYRGNCLAGACQFIAAGSRAAGAACDSGDDCTSGLCSYGAVGFFNDNAHLSVCTDSCTTQGDCDAIGAGLKCSTGGATLCVPTCTTDLDCYADPSSSTVDAGQPWNYYTCTVATGSCAF